MSRPTVPDLQNRSVRSRTLGDCGRGGIDDLFEDTNPWIVALIGIGVVLLSVVIVLGGLELRDVLVDAAYPALAPCGDGDC